MSRSPLRGPVLRQSLLPLADGEHRHDLGVCYCPLVTMKSRADDLLLVSGVSFLAELPDTDDKSVAWLNREFVQVMSWLTYSRRVIFKRERFSGDDHDTLVQWDLDEFLTFYGGTGFDWLKSGHRYRRLIFEGVA